MTKSYVFAFRISVAMQEGEDLEHLWFTQFPEQSLQFLILTEPLMRPDPCLSTLAADTSHRKRRGHGLLAELLSSLSCRSSKSHSILRMVLCV